MPSKCGKMPGFAASIAGSVAGKTGGRPSASADKLQMAVFLAISERFSRNGSLREQSA
jgi:hypothetical protein